MYSLTKINTIINEFNYFEFFISFSSFLINFIFLFMIKNRRPFTPNVRLLLCLISISNCVLTLWILFKNFIVFFEIFGDLKLFLSINLCLFLSGTFYFLPLQFYAFNLVDFFRAPLRLVEV